MEFGFVQLVVLAFDEYGLAEGIRDGLIQRYSELAPRIVADPQTLAAATDLQNVVHINPTLPRIQGHIPATSGSNATMKIRRISVLRSKSVSFE